jgi:hypothetical protein
MANDSTLLSTSQLNSTVIYEKKCRFCMKNSKEFSISGFINEFQSNQMFRLKFFYFILTTILTVILNSFIILTNQKKIRKMAWKVKKRSNRVSALSILDHKTNMSFTSNAIVDLIVGLVCMSSTYILVLFEYWPFTMEACIILSILTLSLGMKKK